MDLMPRGFITADRLDYARRHTGPSWVSCGWWVLSLCPFNCAGREAGPGMAACRGADWVFDDPDPF